MKESGYYPPGAEFDPRAPYNQADEEEAKNYEASWDFAVHTVNSDEQEVRFTFDVTEYEDEAILTLKDYNYPVQMGSWQEELEAHLEGCFEKTVTLEKISDDAK